MAKSHSSYTASPTRFRSPPRSPSRQGSQDGSQYEMDLDALGLNSTFESTELERNHGPPVDRVNTSEIEGPEDFTMNMTYWMTADLPVSQIKSRKEAAAGDSGARMDAGKDQNETQDTTGEGDRVIVEDVASASPTRPLHSTTDEREQSTPASERSMEHEEKVRSFLTTLPDSGMEDALTGTPPQGHKHSFLQVPRSSPPKARSLQATVEDYDTPRKLTQGTVIHHTSAMVDKHEHDTTHDQVAELHSQLEQQSLTSKTRITELETILSYTRAELETARNDNYKHKGLLTSLEQSLQQQKSDAEKTRLSAEAQLKARDNALVSRMQEFGEEMRLQNLAKLQKQREDFDKQVKELREEQAREKQAQESKSNEMLKGANLEGHEKLIQQLSSVQARAESLHAQLEKVTTEAKTDREEAQKKDAARTAMEAKARAQTIRITSLESNLQTAKFELECAQADIAAKQQLFHTNLDLNTRLRTIQSELDNKRTSTLASDGRQSDQTAVLESRITSLQSQLESTRTDLAAKDQQIFQHIQSQERSEQSLNTSQGRIEGLESTIVTLRQQLAEAHRDSAKLRTETERCQGDLEDANDRLRDARAEADRRVMDADKKLSKWKEMKLEADNKLKDLQTDHQDVVEGHEAKLEDIRDRAEDAVRKAGALLEQERTERKRVVKELKKVQEEAAKLRNEAAQRAAEDAGSSSSDDESEASSVSTTPSTHQQQQKEKDQEITSLRTIIRTQLTQLKTLKKENARLNKTPPTSQTTTQISTLEAQLASLGTENASLSSRLEAQKADFDAINRDMDDRLATMLNKLVKERASKAVGKRDGQWAEQVSKVQQEKELMGKVLMRQWGREEVGVADEEGGERQGYGYVFVKRR